MTLNDVYQILVGKKVYDGAWHVYDESDTELTDTGGVLWRANPGALLMWSYEAEVTASVGGGYAISRKNIRRKRKQYISSDDAKAIIERRLNDLQPYAHKPAAADAIAAQSKAFLEAERTALVEQATLDVLTMASRIDAEIKAEFAARQIAEQLQVFEDEMVFAFMIAAEA